jgi:hypothetical protein
VFVSEEGYGIDISTRSDFANNFPGVGTFERHFVEASGVQTSSGSHNSLCTGPGPLHTTPDNKGLENHLCLPGLHGAHKCDMQQNSTTDIGRDS